MIDKEPTAELDLQFSSDEATPIPWAEGRERLEGAAVYWISTVRPDGRPHITPLLSVWLDGALYFCTGPDDRKAKNLDRKSTRLNSSHANISYAVFCLKKKKRQLCAQ